MDTRKTFASNSHTLRNERRDFPEWHLGRPRFALWALDVDFSPVRERVAAASAHLAPYLLDAYERQPHVTVGLCGFPCAEARYADDYATARFDAQIAALRAAPLPRCEIAIGGLSSFTTVPFLEVSDLGGGITELRRRLAGPLDRPQPAYVPHVTVGLYADAWPTAAIVGLLDAFDAEPIHCAIERISLMSYASSKIGGALTRLAEVELASGGLRWHAEPVQGFPQPCTALL